MRILHTYVTATWLLAGGIGCAGTVVEDPGDTVPPRDDDLVLENESASSPSVTVSWREPGRRGSLLATEALGVVVANARRTEAVVVRVTLIAFGLDHREQVVDLRTHRLEPLTRIELSLPLLDLPLQSVGTTSSAVLHAEVVSGNTPDPVRSWSSSLIYEFSDDYRRATLYGLEGKSWDVGTPRDRAEFLTNARVITDTLTNLRGRMKKNASGKFEDIHAFSPVVDGAVLSQSAIVIGPFEQALGNPPPGGGTGPGPDLTNTYSICSVWPTTFQDAGYGEDYLNSPVVMKPPARYARFVVTGAQNQEVLSGYLNFKGCTPALKLIPGTHYFWQDGAHKKGATEIKVLKDNAGGDNGFAIATAFTALPVNTTAIVNLAPPIEFQPMLRASAVVAELLNRNDIDLTPGWVHKIYSYSGPSTNPCPPSPTGAPGSCALFENVNIGWNNSGLSSTHSKFVVAHELGHAIQYAAMGHHDYTFDSNAGQALCRCDHVQSANQVHCLQSREDIGGAQMEGFAHFFASRVFNQKAAGNCTFAYYKEVLKQAGAAPLYPPTAANCAVGPKWMESHCLLAQRGVEWDWMTFYWGVNTATATEQTSMEDLFKIYKDACGGFNCNKVVVSWSTLQAAAQVYHGAVSPKYSKFASAGDVNGVNH